MRNLPPTHQRGRAMGVLRQAMLAGVLLPALMLPAGCRRSGVPGSAKPGAAAGRQADRLEIAPGALGGWNVLLVSIDTLRADHVGCYGHQGIETPVMDGLARRGVRFAQAIAPASSTLPSHASLLTGLNPQHHGARVNGMFKLEPKVATLAEMLASAGYRTAGFVSVALLDRRCGLARGFGHYGDTWAKVGTIDGPSPNERRAATTTAAALSWLDDNGRETFFLWVHYFDPHLSYDPPEPFASRYPSAPYDGEIAYTDQQLGRLLEWLDRNQVRSRTLVIVTADHGEGLGEHDEADHGALLYDSTLHVPLIISGPPPVPQGCVVRRQVCLIDVVPTVLAAAGRPVPAGLDGASLIDPPGPVPRALYIETLAGKFFNGWAPLLGVRRRDHKFIFAPKPELYDLGKDPKELQNVYAARPQVAAELSALLRQMVGSDPEMVTAVQAHLAVTPEMLERLRALGYVAASDRPTTTRHKDAGVPYASLPNPSEMIGELQRYKTALALVGRGHHDKVIELLEPYVAKVPQAGKALLVLGMSYDAKERRAEATACFERAAKLVDRDANIPRMLGAVYMKRGQYHKGIEWIQQALRIDPEDPKSLQLLGQMHRSLDRDDEALAAFGRLMTACNGSYAARAHYEIGRTHLARGRLGPAERALRRALALSPSYAEASKCLAVVRAKRADQDIDRLNRVVATRPTTNSLASLGRLLRERGRPAEAVPHLQQALKAGDARAQTRLQLGLALEATGHRKEATQHLQKAVRLDPNSAEAHCALGNALGRTGQMGEALTHFNRAAELDSTSASARYNAALILCQQSQWDQAVVRLQEAVKLSPHSLDSHLQLARAFEQLGRWTEALACYKRVLRADPQHRQARALLERARRRLHTDGGP